MGRYHEEREERLHHEGECGVNESDKEGEEEGPLPSQLALCQSETPMLHDDIM